MFINFSQAVSALPAVHAALGCEPDIRPDLSNLSEDRLPLVLLSLMNRGFRTVQALHNYLEAHGAPVDWEAIVEAIDDNMTKMQFEDFTADGLWHRSHDGGFTPDLWVTD